MIKILFLLLGVIVLNEADGTFTRVSTEDLSNFDDGKVEVPYISLDPYGNDVAPQKRSNSDKLMRRSSLDKNFMRFGRSGSRERCCKDKDSAWIPEIFEDSNPEQMPAGTYAKRNSIPRAGRVEDNFIRFGRSKSDNFMRFGRGDSFIRFGRGDRDNFMRFGRGNDNFMRFGRNQGDDSDQTSKENFYRSVRNDNFMRFGRISKNDGNFLRFGKSDGKDTGFIRFGRNGTNFLRFGRGNSEETEKIDENADADADASENGPGVRRKRTIPENANRAENNEIAWELPEKLSI